MAWLLEATSSKFVIAGAVLLVHGRVDGHPAILAIAPAAASSAISTRLAKEIDQAIDELLDNKQRRQLGRVMPHIH